MGLLSTSSESISSRLFLDLTDVVSHVLWHQTGTGIQRVQIEITEALMSSGLEVVPFSLYDNVWRDLRPFIESAKGDADKLYAHLRSGHARPERWTSWRRLRRLGARHRMQEPQPPRPRLNFRDILFVGGAFWMNRGAIDLCKTAVARHAKLVVLIHDLIPITNPEFVGEDYAQRYLEVLRLPAHFIVTTRYTLSALNSVRKKLGVGQALSSVVPLAYEFPGTARNYRAQAKPKELKTCPSRPFALCVGTVEIRKNHDLLFRIWEELKSERPDLPDLVIAGRRGWKADAALNKLEEFSHSNRHIIFIEAPSDAVLRWLYSACEFTLYPSFLEGWGLPVAESLWFGKACAASNTSSIPLVGGDLCAYFSPYSPEEMKAAILALLDPRVRHAYEEKIASACLRTWAEVAEDLAEVITHEGSEASHVA